MAGLADVIAAFERVASALEANLDHLTALDQAVGDGDLGITAGKIAAALRAEAAAQREPRTPPAPGAAAAASAAPATTEPDPDLGKLLAQAGMAVNRTASSSFGTLVATALMRAGKAVRGKSELTSDDLAAMLEAADAGIQERGKAKPGDKTIIDVLHPAAEALRGALASGSSPGIAAEAMLAAAQRGLDAVTPLRSKIGRAGWVGERTEGKVDPGGAAGVIMLRAAADA